MPLFLINTITSAAMMDNNSKIVKGNCMCDFMPFTKKQLMTVHILFTGIYSKIFLSDLHSMAV